MITTLKAVTESRRFQDYRKAGVLDAVFASTGPARWMEIARADSAVNAVEDLYGGVQNYGGLWIAGGWLGGLPYEHSQRKNIVDRFVERGVEEERIIQIDGKDTVDKVRELIRIEKVIGGGLEYLGISSYPLHIARFNLALKHAQREGHANPLLKIVGIPTDYSSRPNSDRLARPINDAFYGWMGLLKDARRLDKYGFGGSIPGQNVEIFEKIKRLNSERD